MSDSPTSAAALLVDCLIAQGCERIFTVPGESFLAVLDALLERPQIDLVTCRQEGGAAFMAAADGALTGRPGIAFVTRGPGATNASIGVHVAHQDSQPMILFVGDVARPMQGREGFQEIDFPAFFRADRQVGRADRRSAAHPRTGGARLCRGDQRAARPGGARPARGHARRSRARQPCPAPHGAAPGPGGVPRCLAALLDLIADAASPVAIIGGAGWNAKARHYFQQFAERIGLPVATAFRRQDAIAPDSPVYAGNLGYGPNPKLVERVRNADLILAVGARLGEATTEGYTLPSPDHPGQVLVHVHPDPEELGRVYRTDLALCCSVDEFAECAALWDTGAIIPFGAGAEAHREWLEWASPKPSSAALDSGHVRGRHARGAACRYDHLQRGGQFCRLVAPLLALQPPIPASLPPPAGRWAMACPPRWPRRCASPSAAWSRLPGDGDFLMNGQELATAAQYGANLLVVVVDNGAYGTIRMHQEREYPGRVSATTLANPDFAALARAFGGWSARAETTEAFIAALTEAKDRARHPPDPCRDRS
ncbi:MAG: acetolactate synthase II large subunit [Erythrobacter sp.]|nr:MAG: acetolactate synthase II large subunit [Erythrobacter sp.]